MASCPKHRSCTTGRRLGQFATASWRLFCSPSVARRRLSRTEVLVAGGRRAETRVWASTRATGALNQSALDIEESVAQSISELRSNPYLTQRPTITSLKVVEVLEDGTVLELVKSPFEMHLQPRDFSLFTSDVRLSKQRATIASRDGSILFCTEACRGIIGSNRATLFPLKYHRDTVRLVEDVLSRVGQSSAVPFEFRVLEGLLEATTGFFEKRAQRIRVLLESVVADINTQHRTETSASEFQRLFPIRRALTEMLFDVKETREAIAEVVDNEKLLRSICLTEQQNSPPTRHSEEGGAVDGLTKHMRLASALLDSYERQVETVEGVLKEMEDNMNDAREVWHMQMDSVRNRIIRINLTISIASFSLLLSTLPAGFFGMNLINGLETKPGVFQTVMYACVLMSLGSYFLFYGYYRHWPARKDQQRLTDMKALKDILVHHIDGLDDLLSALHENRNIGRREFDRLVRQTVKGPTISKAEVDLLYRVFYTHRADLLEAGEKLIYPTGRFF